MKPVTLHRLFVDGQRVEEKETLRVVDKFTGETLGDVPVASKETVLRAVAAAHKAFPSYSRMPAHKRSSILERTADLLETRKDEIAALICREAGKAWKYSLGEVGRGIETFRFAAEEAKRLHGETIPLDASSVGEGRLGFYLRCPAGVVAAVTPFNFPLNLAAHKVGPALAAGNTLVLKPASTTPLTAILLGEILEEAGLPPGVFNLVAGPGRTVGEWLCSDARVAQISFTGSPAVGEGILRAAGLKKVTLELGSNSAAIIEPDADLGEAVPRCAMSAFANSGQVCISLQRIYAHRSISRDFTRKLVEETKALKVGNPLDKDCSVGPMIDEAEARRAEAWIQEALAGGAKLLTGGTRKGSVLQPAVLAGVRPDMKVVCGEAFAPIVSIIEYDDFKEAVRLVDDSVYGLQAGIYTRDIGKALYAIDQINVGGVMINDTPIFRADHMPYGGNKLSGLGREGVRFAVEEMTRIKMVVLKA
jgi:acyl-CoA reductase-like NAD-dependent aldehyde dehydrogenase